MKRQLPPLLALRAFEAAGRHLSFSRAADELNVTQGAVSRQIKVLEEHLGQQLFIRVARAVVLSEFGNDYYAAIAKALEMIERASVKKHSKKHDLLKISVTQSLGSLWLMPRLSSFSEAYPDIEVSVAASLQPADFGQNDYDVAIRLGRLPGQRYSRSQPSIPHALVKGWEGVSAFHLWDEVLTPVMNRSLLKPDYPLCSPADLLKYKLLHVTVRPNAWPDWFRSQRTPYHQGPHMGFGHFFMALEAARRGLGVALAPTLLIGDMDKSHDLVCPFPSSIKSAGAYYLLCRESRASEKIIRLFRKWLLEQGKEYQ